MESREPLRVLGFVAKRFFSLSGPVRKKGTEEGSFSLRLEGWMLEVVSERFHNPIAAALPVRRASSLNKLAEKFTTTLIRLRDRIPFEKLS